MYFAPIKKLIRFKKPEYEIRLPIRKRGGPIQLVLDVSSRGTRCIRSTQKRKEKKRKEKKRWRKKGLE